MSLLFQFSCLSSSAAVDQQTGNLSVFDVIDDLRAQQVPFQVQSMVISISGSKTVPGPVKGRVFIHLITPDESQHLVGQGEMEVPSEQHRIKAVFRFANFPVKAFGHHRFVLSWVNEAEQKESESIIDFEAVQVTEPTKNAGPTTKPPSQGGSGHSGMTH